MPDWKQLDWDKKVRERMAPLNLPANSKGEVVAELAAHLAETYDAARTHSLVHDAAVELTLQEVRDWRVLANEISRAKSEENFMTNRTRTLWLPAAANLLAAMLLLMMMQKLGVQPRLLWVNVIAGKFALVFYFAWLIVLPCFGAAGAYLSRLAQGGTFARLISGLSPALVLIALICLIGPWGLLIDGLSIYRLVLIAGGLLTWGVLPACALLIGALPFLRQNTPSKSSVGESQHA
jgi:hypothetical protein